MAVKEKEVKRTLALLTILAVVATIIDQYVIHCTDWAGWIYIFLGWFVAWLVIFFIMRRNWLYSIATVFIISVAEDALFLLWNRIIGRTDWSASFYCHDWIPFCQDWGIPSTYVYSLVIAGCLVWIEHKVLRK